MKLDNQIAYKPLDYDVETSEKRAIELRDYMERRRSIRFFSDKAVSKELIKNLLLTGSSAPSGAHKQPWTFCAISNAQLKSEIRAAAENEEYESYNGRMSEEWLEDLKQFGTDWHKEFIDVAPWIIVVFKKAYDLTEDGKKTKNYYVNESVGLACGFLLSAIHNAGLVSLTHTPSPMNFLQKILNRPANERPFLLIPVGYPKDGVQVPDLKRKTLDEMTVWFE